MKKTRHPMSQTIRGEGAPAFPVPAGCPHGGVPVPGQQRCYCDACHASRMPRTPSQWRKAVK
jgi:hypothetical protein